MKIKWNTTFFYGLALGIMLLLVSGRLFTGGFDFSYFMVGGTDFIDTTHTLRPVIVQPGQGYDGQFFYRYALNPFDFSKTSYGITVDLVPYRMQRMGYPFLAWLLSFFGVLFLVPPALVVVNVLSFFGIIYFTNRFIQLTRGDTKQMLFPFFLCGIYMAVAKDLSEVTELFFFMGALFYFLKASHKKFAFFASMAVLCRETSMVALFPLVIYAAMEIINKRESFLRILWLLTPFVVFALWKWCIIVNTESTIVVQGSGNIGLPFIGMMQGFRGNLDISTTKNKLQLGFWIMYFIWQFWLTATVVSCLSKNFSFGNIYLKPLAVVYITWFIFAIFLSAAVYVDDWSFVRVFSLWSMTGFLILIVTKRNPGKMFVFYSVMIVCLTLGRLIIRP